MAAGAAAADGGGSGSGNGGGSGGGNGGAFACNICLEPAREAVIGRCGHLYCWPCLHQWLRSRSRCAVCGAQISRDSVVPLYGRGANGSDPRTETPPRPRGQRPEPETQQVPPPGPSRTFQVSFGFGAFPFPAPPPPSGGGGEPPSVDSVFLFVAAAFFLWLLSV